MTKGRASIVAGTIDSLLRADASLLAAVNTVKNPALQCLVTEPEQIPAYDLPLSACVIYGCSYAFAKRQWRLLYWCYRDI